MLKENNFKRMCSFYVSSIHLSTMILPYLSKKLEKGEIITTFLEKDIQEEIRLLLSKTNIKNELKNTINAINWHKTRNIKYLELEKHLNKYNGKINILVVGTEEYINNINENIQRYLSRHNDININVIDAYELEENKQNFSKILENYTYMLNTSGEHLVKEVFKIDNSIGSKEVI